jgi:signal transduction histidine kinase
LRQPARCNPFPENAIKYNRQGGTVAVSAAKKVDRIRIRFEDTGIGIPENELSKIFERFYRCDANRFESGTGLGLSLAGAIAHALGGTIQVTSTVDRGSTFSVTLPA